MELIRAKIRDVADFPKPGIIFKDITPILQDSVAFRATIDELASRLQVHAIDHIAAIESRGFLFGAALAYKLGVGLIVVRKPNKLPWTTHRQTYDLEYGSDSIEVHVDSVSPGERVLIVDDLLATGGTVAATIRLFERLNAHIVGTAVVVELAFLNGRQRLGEQHPVTSLVVYE